MSEHWITIEAANATALRAKLENLNARAISELRRLRPDDTATRYIDVDAAIGRAFDIPGPGISTPIKIVDAIASVLNTEERGRPKVGYATVKDHFGPLTPVSSEAFVASARYRADIVEPTPEPGSRHVWKYAAAIATAAAIGAASYFIARSHYGTPDPVPLRPSSTSRVQ